MTRAHVGDLDRDAQKTGSYRRLRRSVREQQANKMLVDIAARKHR